MGRSISSSSSTGAAVERRRWSGYEGIVVVRSETVGWWRVVAVESDGRRERRARLKANVVMFALRTMRAWRQIFMTGLLGFTFS